VIQLYIILVDPLLAGHTGLDNFEQKSSQKTGKRLLKTLAAPETLDHWNTQTKKVSLREIMSEEIALQEKHDLVWVGTDTMLRTCDFHLILCLSYLTWMKELLKLKGV
jgi:hypothetical protein